MSATDAEVSTGAFGLIQTARWSPTTVEPPVTAQSILPMSEGALPCAACTQATRHMIAIREIYGQSKESGSCCSEYP
jgi:hypothetical protein